jgi:hypothetical protein
MSCVNPPVRDLGRARRFDEKLGFAIDEPFSRGRPVRVVIPDVTCLMLRTHAKSAGSTPRPIADDTGATARLLALSCTRRSDIDAIVEAAGAGGWPEQRPTPEFGFIDGGPFADLEAQVWEPTWLDPAATAGRAQSP